MQVANTQHLLAPSLTCRHVVLHTQYQSVAGHFNLDPNRVLDIFLDVYIENVEEHAEHFLSLFEASPWNPNHYDVMSPEIIIKLNRDMAIIMGAKFVYHQQSEASSPLSPKPYRAS